MEAYHSHVRCIWCEHVISEDKRKSGWRRRLKAECEAHDLACPESPMVRRLAKQDKLLLQMGKTQARLIESHDRKMKGGKLLGRYMNPRRRLKKDVLAPLMELTELARGTAETDDVLCLSRRGNPCACALCEKESPVCPMRLPDRGHTLVLLLCDDCVPREREGVDEIVSKTNDLKEAYAFDSVFLWCDNGRIRMISNGLEIETIR